jgi:hypothetical protein
MINNYIATSYCFVVVHNNVDDYRIVELDVGNEVSSLLPFFEPFSTYELAVARIPLEYKPNE